VPKRSDPVPDPTSAAALPVYVSAKDLARRWRCSVAFIYALANRGAIPAFRIGNFVRFRIDAVAAYEADHEFGPSYKN
jgi:excisionase family DNA binding protein